MSPYSSKFYGFWKELKRRNVLRSLAVYAGSAFVILEAVSLIFPRWGLPDWTIDLVLYLLIFGALVNLVVSWFFDITPTGILKTQPVEEESDEKAPSISNAWKWATYISLVVIVVLIVWNVVPQGRNGKGGPIDSLVILPFDNFTGDDQLENVIAGMHSLLIGDIGRINGLRVISPTTARVYKKEDMSIPDIAAELGVNAVIEPTVMCYGDSVCFQVKVVTPFPEEKLLWVADYREEKSQVLNLYNKITRQIAEKVKIELSPEQQVRLAQSRTVNPEALDAYLKGQIFWERLGKEDMDSAIHYFRIAVEKDPDWADPYAGLAMSWQVIGGFAYGPLNESTAKASSYLDVAQGLDPNSENSHYVRALTSTWVEWNWQQGESEFRKTLELNSNHALCRVYYAHLLMILRRFDEAIHQAELALSLDPMRPLVLGLYGVVMNATGNYHAALDQSLKALAIDPDNNFALGPLMGACLGLGDTLKWYETARSHFYWTNEAYLDSLDQIFSKEGYLGVIRDRIRVNEEVLREGGAISFTGQAGRYLVIGNTDRALDYYEKAYEERFGLLSYLSTDDIRFPELRDNPRYIKLLEKMNLPLPE